MPFHTPQIPWLDIDHTQGKITCTRCKTTTTFSTDSPKGELEVLMDNLRPFARAHADCEEPPQEDADRTALRDDAQRVVLVDEEPPKEKRRESLSAKTKRDIVLSLLRGARFDDLAAAYNVPKASIRQWTRQFLDAGLEGLEDDPTGLRELFRELRRLSPDELLTMGAFLLGPSGRLLFDLALRMQDDYGGNAYA